MFSRSPRARIAAPAVPNARAPKLSTAWLVGISDAPAHLHGSHLAFMAALVRILTGGPSGRAATRDSCPSRTVLSVLGVVASGGGAGRLAGGSAMERPCRSGGRGDLAQPGDAQQGLCLRGGGHALHSARPPPLDAPQRRPSRPGQEQQLVGAGSPTASAAQRDRSRVGTETGPRRRARRAHRQAAPKTAAASGEGTARWRSVCRWRSAGHAGAGDQVRQGPGRRTRP